MCLIYFSTTTMQKIETWEQIPKKKLKKLNKQQIDFKKIEQGFSLSIPVKVLESIKNKNEYLLKTNQPLTPHDDLIHLVSHPDLLRLAFWKLSKNKGAMTPGTQGNTADSISEDQIQTLSQQIKTGKFKWSPIQRIYIPKPGKTALRPLGLPDFNNKMVQESIRLILESIYEPEFNQLDCNSGFRPHRDCNYAIRKISQKAQFSDYAIEGDIEGAYDNVDHDKMIDILKKRIKDHKFLQLIKQGFKAGILEDYTYKDTFLGVPQGGITSPILFNIYMHEFDKYIINNLKTELDNTNKNKETKEITTEYATTKTKLARAKKATLENKFPIFRDLIYILKENQQQFQNINFVKNEINQVIKEVEENEIYQPGIRVSGNQYAKYRQQLIRHLTPQQKELIIELHKTKLKKEVEILTAKLRNTPYLDIDRKTSKIYYHRYADDWTLWIRGNFALAKELKDKIATYLQTELSLKLSPTKTLITNLQQNKATFLGFEIYFPKNPILRRKSNNLTSRIRSIQVAPDTKRLISRFQNKGYLQKGKPREIGWLTVLTNQEIITKYNQFMIGVGNYYIPEINQPSLLARWHYYLYYSCIKTLATKNKISVKHVIKKYGFKDLSIPLLKGRTKATDLRICIKYEFNNTEKWSILLNYKEFMYKLKQYKTAYRNRILNKTKHPLLTPPIDFMSMHKANFRTKFKLTSHCTICGSTEYLQNHHIKPIKFGGGKFTGYKSFDKLVASLNRKQITVCKCCHQAIHSGKYNGLSLEDLYDARLAIPETYIKLEDSNNPPTPVESKTKPGPLILINEKNKTYLNTEFRNYLTKLNYGKKKR